MKSTFSIKYCFAGLLASIALGAVAHAGAVTATFSAQASGSGLGSVDGTDLAVGSLVRFGYFDGATDFGAMLNDLSLLNTHFTELGSAKVGFFGGISVVNEFGAITSHTDGTNYNVPGAFTGIVSLSPSPVLENTRLYMWAYNSSSMGGATAHAIFSDDAWKLGAFGTPVFELRTANPLDANDIYLAVQGPQVAASGIGGTLNKLVGVPEPGSFLLGLGAFVSCLLRRKRGSTQLS
jgi:hypothetical protein